MILFRNGSGLRRLAVSRILETSCFVCFQTSTKAYRFGPLVSHLRLLSPILPCRACLRCFRWRLSRMESVRSQGWSPENEVAYKQVQSATTIINRQFFLVPFMKKGGYRPSTP
jgi:hypothetical protein